MMLSRSGTFIDTMSSGSNRAGIPSSVSATSNAFQWGKEDKGKGSRKSRKQKEMLAMRQDSQEPVSLDARQNLSNSEVNWPLFLLKIKTLISTNLVTAQLVLLLRPNVVSWYDFYQYFISLLLGVVVETCGSVVSVLFRRMEMISG